MEYKFSVGESVRIHPSITRSRVYAIRVLPETSSGVWYVKNIPVSKDMRSQTYTIARRLHDTTGCIYYELSEMKNTFWSQEYLIHDYIGSESSISPLIDEELLRFIGG